MSASCQVNITGFIYKYITVANQLGIAMKNNVIIDLRSLFAVCRSLREKLISCEILDYDRA